MRINGSSSSRGYLGIKRGMSPARDERDGGLARQGTSVEGDKLGGGRAWRGTSMAGTSTAGDKCGGNGGVDSDGAEAGLGSGHR